MIIGLENNEKCVYIVDERTKNEIIDAFKKANIDIEKYIKSKQFVFLTKRQAYLKNGYFDPDRMIKLLRQTERLALKEGYKGLRATGEMSWSFTKLPGVERLIEYEAKLNNFFPKSKCIAICQYNEKKFNAEILLDVLHTHSITVIHGSVCENPYFIPSFEFIARMEGKIPKGIYERVRDGILERDKIHKDRNRAIEALKKAYDELEIRVKDRTKELEKMKKKLEEYAKRLEIKVKKLEKKKVKLTEREKRVFYSLVKWPDINDIELSKKIGIKRPTITAIRNRLLKKKWMTPVNIPNFLGMGCKLIGFSYGRISYSEIARKFKVMKNEFKIPEVVLMLSTNENYIGILFFKDFINSQMFETSIMNNYNANNQKRTFIFPLELLNTYKLMDFSESVRDVFELKFQPNGGVLPPSKSLSRLSNKDKRILYALVKYPHMKMGKISALLKISIPTITKIKKKLIKEGFIKRVVIPNVKKLNQPILLLHARFNQKKDSDTIEESKRKISNILNEFVRVELRDQVIMLGVFNDFYAEKEAKLHELLDLLHKRGYLIDYPEIITLPAKNIMLQKMDFASITKKVLDIKTEI